MREARRRARATSLRGAALTVASLLSLPAEAAPPLDPDPGFLERLGPAIADRLAGRAPRVAYSSTPEVVLTPRFIYARDRALSLPGPPWSTEAGYVRAFELAKSAWYESQGDHIRALVVLTTFDEGGKSLFYLPLANDIAGLGEGAGARVFDDTPDLELEGYVWLGSQKVLEAAGDAYFREAFLHEIAHRWTAYVAVAHPEFGREGLRGRQSSHWSFLVDTRGSPMEGNRWERTSGDRWETVIGAEPDGFSDLDLYLMGVLPPEEVHAFDVLLSWREVEPSWFVVRPDAPPAHRSGISVALRPERVATVTMEHVIAGSGPRLPPAEDRRVTWPVGVVLLSDGLHRATQHDLERLDLRLASLAEDFGAATGGRVTLELTVRGAGRAPLGAPCARLADCDRSRADLCAPPGAGRPAICTRACTAHAQCPGATCCVQSGAGALVCGPASVCEELPPINLDGGASEEPSPVDPLDLDELARRGCGCEAGRGSGAPGLVALAALLICSGSLRRGRRPGR